eukprot:scaffold252793_cov35-Attheya_sp.AAC.1
MLEQVRLVDIGNAWVVKTMAAYQTFINRMLRFETRLGIPILTPETLAAPACSPSIALHWCQELYAWQAPVGNRPNSEKIVSFAMVRKLRSAVANFFEWDIQVSHPNDAIREHGSGRPLITRGCRPTDTLQYALVSAGMGKRLGKNNKPPTALTYEHVAGMIVMCTKQWYDDLPPRAQ